MNDDVPEAPAQTGLAPVAPTEQITPQENVAVPQGATASVVGAEGRFATFGGNLVKKN